MSSGDQDSLLDAAEHVEQAALARGRGETADEPRAAAQQEPPERPVPPLDPDRPAVVVAVCNQKGGVGKTTTTINLGAALAELDRRVLLVDLDPQGGLSIGLGLTPAALDATVNDLLLDPRGTEAHDVVVQTHVPGLDLLPSNIELSAAEVQLVAEVGREQALSRVLRPLRGDYDVILVDCQPSLGLLTVNALTAASAVVVPLECEYFAMHGLALLVQTIEKVADRLNPDLEVLGVLATMYDGRTLHAREVLGRVREGFGDLVFEAVINRTVKFPETSTAGEPITRYAGSSPGAAAYRSLAREVLERVASR